MLELAGFDAGVGRTLLIQMLEFAASFRRPANVMIG
jgi:hypothetical protein